MEEEEEQEGGWVTLLSGVREFVGGCGIFLGEGEGKEGAINACVRGCGAV